MTDQMHINWDIIVRRILDEASDEEIELVERWLAEDEMNREYYQKAKRYFDRYYTGEETRSVDVEDAWDEFVDYAARSKQVRKLHAWRYVAAVVLPLLGVGVGYWALNDQQESKIIVAEQVQLDPGETKAVLLSHTGKRVGLVDSITLEQALEQVTEKNQSGEKDTMNKQEAVYNTVLVPKGGEYRLVLPDRTSVVLNADSKLSIPDEFVGKERRVKLDGEAFFDVSKDAERPFIVETASGCVKVLGTKFNLSVYANDEFVQTTLVEGKVVFQGNDRVGEKVLNPGEQVTYDKVSGKLSVARVNTAIYTAWTEGKWIVEGVRLEDIMKQLSRWYDVTVFYMNQEAKNLVFSGDLERYKNCETILDIISLSTNVEFAVKDRVITVKMR